MRRTIDELLESLRHARERKTRISVLIGAGCSVTAGIPLASGFVKEIEKDYPHKYARADNKTYPALMGELTRGERRDLIFKYIDDAKINWAHIALAQLVQAGVIERILTVNFDPLVIRACALIGIYPAVYDFGASQRFTPGAVVDPSVFYLHGQRSGFVTLNTDEEVNRHAELLMPVFHDAGRARLWLVVGYSGDNDPVFKQLAAIPFFEHGLFWIGYNDAEPSQDVREQLLEAGKDAFYVNGLDADEFFVRVAKELGCFPPDIVAKPFTHLNKTLQKVAPYRFSKLSEPVDILEHARKYITTASEQLEPAQADGLQAWSDLIGGNLDSVIALRGKYPDNLHPDLADAITWAYLEQGNELMDEAATKSGAEADGLRGRAEEKYAEAVSVKADDDAAFYNWGNLLMQWAQTKSGAEADVLRGRAEEKFEEAVRLKEDYHAAFTNWGLLLAEWAQTKSGAEADALRGRAEEKYAEAVRLKADDDAAFNNWGLLLAEWARTKSGAEADGLRGRAEEKYAAVVSIKADKHEAFNNWGSLLDDWARTKSGAEADGLRGRAEEKYAAAVSVKADMHEAFHNWGLLLAQWARTKSGAEADALRGRAEEKYAAAVRLKADDDAAFNNWGLLLAEWARTKSGAEADGLRGRAEEKYAAAVRLKADDHEAFYNWAIMLKQWGQLKEPSSAEKLYQRADEKYAAASAIAHDADDILRSWGNLFLFWIQVAEPERKAELLARAEEYLLASNSLRRGPASYDLACVYSLKGDQASCRKYLIESKESNNLPSRSHLEQDTDFDPVRHTDWFQEFLAALPPE